MSLLLTDKHGVNESGARCARPTIFLPLAS